MQLLFTNGQFSGLLNEDPTVHIKNFLEISDTHTTTGVNKDYMRITLFPFPMVSE